MTKQRAESAPDSVCTYCDGTGHDLNHCPDHKKNEAKLQQIFNEGAPVEQWMRDAASDIVLDGLTLQVDTAAIIARHYAQRETTEGDKLVEMQKHRDKWRGYAYGINDKPQDFLDGNMVDRPPTFLETNALLLHEAMQSAALLERMREASVSLEDALRERDKNNLPYTIGILNDSRQALIDAVKLSAPEALKLRDKELREKVLAGLPITTCKIVWLGYSDGATCLDVAAVAKQQPERYAEGHREKLMALEYACYPCKVKAWLRAQASPPAKEK